MAREELVSMLVGAGAGYLIGSAGKATGAEPTQCPECISTPLYNEVVTPRLPTLEDYEKQIIYSVPQTTSYFFVGILKGSDAKYYYTTYMYNFELGTSKFTFKQIVGKNQETVTVSGFDEPATVQKSEGILAVETQSGKYIINTNTHTTYLIIQQTSGFQLNLAQNGNPYWYCDEQIAVIKPGVYLWGFEVIGLASGNATINSLAVSLNGMGDSEHSSWNFQAGDILIKEEWILFSTLAGKVQGVLWNQSVGYKEAGIWINGAYYKPITYEINNLEYINGKVGNVNVILYFTDFIMQIKMTNIGIQGQESIYGIEVYINGNLYDTGFANYEMQPNLIPFKIW